MNPQESVQCIVTAGGISITLSSGSDVTIPTEVLQRSKMLRDAFQIDSVGDEMQIVAPCGFVESWLQSADLLPTGCESLEAPSLNRLLHQLQAADFFQDERTVASLADIIGPKVLSGRAALTDELAAAVQVLHKMSSNTVMAVLNASHASLHAQLALLPASLHPDVMLCAFPNIKAEGSLCLETSVHTTASISTALATAPSLRGLKHLEVMGICYCTPASRVFKQLTEALHTALQSNVESLSLEMVQSEGSMALLQGVINCLEHSTAFKSLTLEGGSMEHLIKCEEMQSSASLSKLKGLESLALTDSHCAARRQRKAEDRIPAGLECQTQLTRLQITVVMRAGSFAPFLSTLVSLKYLEIACMAESISEAEQLAAALRCLEHLTTLLLTVGSVGMASLMHCHRCPLHDFYVDPSDLEDIEASEGQWDPLLLHPSAVLAAEPHVGADGEQSGVHGNPGGSSEGASVLLPAAAAKEPDSEHEAAGMSVQSAAENLVASVNPLALGAVNDAGGVELGSEMDGAGVDAQAAEPEQGQGGGAEADNGMQMAVHAMYDAMDNVEMNELNELQQAIEGQMLAGNLEGDLHTDLLISDGNYASDGSVCRAVVESVQHLPKLQKLHVACRNRHDSTFHDVCSNSVLQTLSRLQSLTIEDTSSGVVRVLDLLPSAGQLTRFAVNVLSTCSACAVINIRDKLPNLKSLREFNGCLKLCDEQGILRKGFPAFVGPSGLKELTTFHLGLHEICRDPSFNFSRPTNTETVASVASGFMSVLRGPEKLRSLSILFERLNQYRERDAGDPADSLKGVLGTISESAYLTSLFLDSAAVGDDCAKALAQSVRGLKSLKCLTCFGTFRDVNALGAFCVALGGAEMSSLQILRLDSGVFYEGASIEFFTAEGMRSLLSALSGMKELDSLMIDGYGISDTSMKGLAEVLPGMKNLQHLYLHNCGMTDTAAASLAQHVEHVKTLQSLDLSLNNFSHDGVRILAESIIKLPMVQSLKMPLSLTAASHRCINALCKLLRSSPTLVQLDLHCTALMGSYHNGRVHAMALMDALESDPLRCRSLQRRCSWFKPPSRKRPRRS